LDTPSYTRSFGGEISWKMSTSKTEKKMEGWY